MKFKIRFADQIVGFFVMLAIVLLIIVVFLLGSRHRWFANDSLYKTVFSSASGLSVNMPLLYKGFTIGNIKSLQLNEQDDVEVIFSVHENYANRVRKGSVVELVVSPIGLGASFVFYSGIAREVLEPGSFVPRIDSLEGKDLIAQGLAWAPGKDDSISNVLSQVNTVLADVDIVLKQVQDAFAGRGDSPVAHSLNNIDGAIANISEITNSLDGTLQPVLANLNKITADFSAVSSELANPDGFVMKELSPDGTLAQSLDTALAGIAGTITNLEKTTAFIPQQLPQVAALIAELRRTLQTAEEVLIAVRNNPLLKNGVPERAEVQSSGTNPRDIAF
jgi:phospholipid/cholesterol/gamma-HCH transport system substrate-binding protein